MRRKARVDRNQPEIVEALRKVGASVAPTHTAGQGFPDLVVGYRGDNYLIEVKDGNKPPSKRKLNKQQVEFHGSWVGQIDVANDIDEALEIIGAK